MSRVAPACADLAVDLWGGRLTMLEDLGHGAAWWVATTTHEGLFVDLGRCAVEERHLNAARDAGMLHVLDDATIWVTALDAGSLYAPLLALDWLRVAYAQRLSDDAARSFLGADEGLTECRRLTRLWCPTYYAALAAGDDGQDGDARIRMELLMSGVHLAVCATAEAADRMHVQFADILGDRVAYEMDRATYEAIPPGTIASPEDYALFGPLDPCPPR